LIQSYLDPAQGGDPDTPLVALAFDFWNGSAAQVENFRTNGGITYPMLLLAGAAGVGQAYACSYHVYFVVDGDGIIRYRNDTGSWEPGRVGAAIDAALASLLIGVPDIPDRDVSRLEAAYPNPFNPSTTIPYSLAGSGEGTRVELRVVDLRGRHVRSLVSEQQATGQSYAVRWDGRDDAGRVLASGGYLVELTVAGRTQGRFLTLVK
jgi:hypothetical protein